ncbi:UNC93-like protein 3 isoform X2 [Prosopis cineraria]|uniref:UNC93-like protein 3 isoform X2 n=1 Tax=Prosopis cineraria TaxID=364024 RepID=UPI0024102C40|nr:UNC93-like protein 3 isoform X2 [Prosopis cineraria]
MYQYLFIFFLIFVIMSVFLAAGRLISGLPSITSIVCVVQAVVFILLLLDISMASGELNTLYLLFWAALLGIGDGVLNTQLSALLGMLFKHDSAMLLTMLASLSLSFGSFLFLALKVA